MDINFAIAVTYIFTIDSTFTSPQSLHEYFATNFSSLSTFSFDIDSACAYLSSVNCFFAKHFVLNITLKPAPQLPVIDAVII